MSEPRRRDDRDFHLTVPETFAIVDGRRVNLTLPQGIGRGAGQFAYALVTPTMGTWGLSRTLPGRGPTMTCIQDTE